MREIDEGWDQLYQDHVILFFFTKAAWLFLLNLRHSQPANHSDYVAL
jgi:hypothetical protein